MEVWLKRATRRQHGVQRRVTRPHRPDRIDRSDAVAVLRSMDVDRLADGFARVVAAAATRKQVGRDASKGE